MTSDLQMERPLPAIDHRVISVDDHVIEPPNLWAERLPAKYRDAGPRVVRGTVDFTSLGRPDSRVADTWVYDDAGISYPHTATEATAGFERWEMSNRPLTYEEMHPSCYDPSARLLAMDEAGIDASLCFPSMFPRFCGQAFLWGKDKELSLLGVQAYNDWMLEEWCGDSGGRLIPLSIVPLWDPELAAAEVRRTAARGCRAITFSENPVDLGLPSIHGPHWSPLFEACQETGVVVNMHIGSSSKLPTTAPDAPPSVAIAVSAINTMFAFTDLLLSGVLVRFPGVRFALSEGQAGWMPFMMERIDKVWHNARTYGGVDEIPEPPSSYMPGRIYACIFDDDHALACRDVIGVDQMMFEVDFPHQDTTWPYTQDVVGKIASQVDDVEMAKITRGNAVRLYDLSLPA
ncbi:MAG: amidohydrolase family protein [Mycetocola sp.]